MIHLHLDALGGLAGDMFVAALLSAFPDLEAVVAANVRRAAPPGTRCRVSAHGDGVLTGARFVVEDAHGRPAEDGADHGHAHAHEHEHEHEHGHGGGHRHARHGPHGRAHEHGHRAWMEIRDGLRSSGLPDGVLRHALGIFGVLATAEARVHGVEPDAVRFHEVGAADSIADVVAAATLIDALEESDGPAGWSVSALPLGGGRVRSAHGPMPVPAPATAVLLDGFAMNDDGVAGERVTPTGAAILRWLRNEERLAERRPAGRLAAAGTGFGSRTLPGISNCLRVLALRSEAAGPVAATAAHRELAVIGFEVDDQTAEDLATGLDRVRATAGVHDVVQMPCFGKKNRMATHVQVLAAPNALEAAVAACFRETATIGLRVQTVHGRALARRFARVALDGEELAVKLVCRPDGTETGKLEADQAVAADADAAGRAALRRRAEAAALDATAPGRDR